MTLKVSFEATLLLIPSHDAGLREMLVSLSDVKNKIILYLTFKTRLSLPDNLIVIRCYNERQLTASLSWKKKVIGLLPAYITDFVDFALISLRVRKSKLSLRKLIKENNISHVIVSQDREIGPVYSTFLLKKEFDLKIILLSFAESAALDSIAKIRDEKFYYQKKLDWNSREWNGRYLSFFTKSAKKHIEKNCSKEINPFISGSTFCDLALLHSRHEFKRLIQMGANPNKYVVTGNGAHDKLFDAATEDPNEIINSYFPDKKKGFLLLAVPVYYEHALANYSTHVRLITDLIEELCKTGKPLLLALHPKADPKNYKNFINENVKIAIEPTYKLVPHCEVFISAFSSVTEWALCFDKAVILIDQLGLNYHHFFRQFNIPIVTKKECITSSVNSALLKKPSYEKRFVCDLAVIDGQAKQRIKDALGLDNGA